MDTRERERSEDTLRNVISESTDVSNLNSYYTIFGIQLFFRFSDPTDLDVINADQVRKVARFSLGCARIGDEVWNESLETEHRRVSSRQTRAA